MNVILSRKGFDSAYGGFASPIFFDNRMLSLPIPSKKDGVKYSDLLWENETYYKLMKDLSPRIKIKTEGESKTKWEDLSEETTCHFDPDILSNAKTRLDGWKGMLGQAGRAQGHLTNNRIGKDDLFLFFGWFRRINNNSGNWQYDKDDYDKHVIFGYLQVQNVIPTPYQNTTIAWMGEHPHVSRAIDNDAIYVAREKLSWDANIPGWGTFDYSEDLVLTKAGLTKSFWKPNPVFKDVEMSYNKKSWKGDYFKSAAIGQEFVIMKDDTGAFLKWAKNLIEEPAKPFPKNRII